MTIPELQLETWSHQGSVEQSRATYAIVREVLEHAPALKRRSTSIFLQGSYGNDTNVRGVDSDVDVVLLCDETFFSDTTALEPADAERYERNRTAAWYGYSEYRADVLGALTHAFGNDVVDGNKAISIRANGTRRKADVLPAMSFRRYHRFIQGDPGDYSSGICFFTKAWDRVVNYPQQHSINLTRKHQAAYSQLKPHVRILKNLRNRLTVDGSIPRGLAPSYFLEGLLYNAPHECFANSRSANFARLFDWMRNTDRTKLLCANEEYYLLNDSNRFNCWNTLHFEQFRAEAEKLWTNWR